MLDLLVHPQIMILNNAAKDEKEYVNNESQKDLKQQNNGDRYQKDHKVRGANEIRRGDLAK